MKTPSTKELLAKIEALEKKVAELEARPMTVIHNHQLAPLQPIYPSLPGTAPGYPWTITCQTRGGSGQVSVSELQALSYN